MTQIQRIRDIVESGRPPARKVSDIAEIVRSKRVYKTAGLTKNLKAYHKARYRRLRDSGLCTLCEKPSTKSVCATCATAKKKQTQRP